MAGKITKKISKHIIRLGIGIIYILVTCGISFFIIGVSNLQSLFSCACLGLAGGALILFPRRELSLKTDMIVHGVLFIVYGIFIPRIIFERTELPIHDMSGLIQDIWKVNVLLIVILFFLTLLCLQRTSCAFVVTGVICLLLTIINYYVNNFRGTTLAFADLISFRTGMMVMGNYSYTISTELWRTILCFFVIILLGARIDVKVKGWKYHIAVTLFSMAGLLCGYFAYTHSPVLQIPGARGEAGNIYAGQRGYGLYYYLVLSHSATVVERPAGYSDELLTQIVKELEEDHVGPSSDQKPDIILIMNEAWADLRVLGKLETTTSFSPFLDSLEQNTVKGNTYVNIWGGHDM